MGGGCEISVGFAVGQGWVTAYAGPGIAYKSRICLGCYWGGLLFSTYARMHLLTSLCTSNKNWVCGRVNATCSPYLLPLAALWLSDSGRSRGEALPPRPPLMLHASLSFCLLWETQDKDSSTRK